MVDYKIKTLSTISPKGLKALSQSSCIINDDDKDPDGILIILFVPFLVPIIPCSKPGITSFIPI